MSAINTIAIVGTGNVGSYFLPRFSAKGVRVTAFSRSAEGEVQPLQQLFNDASAYDLILLCVKDDAIAEVSGHFSQCKALVAHVSGAMPIATLDTGILRKAVFYPLMSIQKNSDVELEQIPLCLEAEQEEDLEILVSFGEKIGSTTYRVNSEQRTYLHLAAVFAHNFSNHLLLHAEKILKKKQLPLQMLLPLLQNHLQKISAASPFELQTGPARRDDRETIKRHLENLADPLQQEIYQLLTKSIQKTYDQEL